MKLIAGRLPDYLINKWADVSYSIREKGRNPGLEDLAKFVKRQAAIKNDPGFAGVVVMPTKETRANKNCPTEVKSLRFQRRPHPLLLISLRKTRLEGQEQVMDPVRVSPYSEDRAVCVALVHMN